MARRSLGWAAASSYFGQAATRQRGARLGPAIHQTALAFSDDGDLNHRMPPARTMFEKIWNRHVVATEEGDETLLYIDRA